jgi:membrane protein DedA with SNARE-associated domain
MDTASFIIQYGYIALFLLTLLEGETAVALAGYAAYQGYLELPLIIPIAVIGASLGDQLFFLFGRWKGNQYLARRPKYREKVDRVHGWMERYRDPFIFGSRFMYGFRIIIPVVMGTSAVSYWRFLFLNVFGAIVWAGIFSALGYMFGGAIEVFLGNMRRMEEVALVLVVLVLFLVQIVFSRYVRKKVSMHRDVENKN